MSLYRPIPPLNLAANVEKPLSPRNWRDYGKLLYWIFFFPQAIRDYVGPKAALAAIKARTYPTAPDAEVNKGDEERALQAERQQRQRPLIQMSAVLLLALTIIVAIVIFFAQMGLDLRWGAALNSGIGAVPLGLLLAGIVFLVAQWQKQPVNGIVLGVATGLVTTIISMFALGELLDDHFLGMGRALGYGFVSGSSVGILSNLATTLARPVKTRPTTWHTVVGALVSGLVIFLINSVTPSDGLVDLNLSQENGLAVLSGILAFFSGALLGQRRPLDWLLAKIHLNWQVHHFTSDQFAGKFTERASIFTHYAPGLEAIFAPVAPPSFTAPPALPHVTYYPIKQLRQHVETWLDHEWERGLTVADQLWRYTNQQDLLIGAVQQVLHEKKPEDQVAYVSQFVNKVSDIAWAMMLYPLSRHSVTVAEIQDAKQPKPPADKVTATTVRAQARRYEHQRWQIQQEVTNLRDFGHLPLDTAAQKTVAGFWYLHNCLIDESILAFAGLPASDLTKELQAIAATIEKLLHAQNLLVDRKLDWPERPKEPKRKTTWDAFDKFKLVVRYGRLYHQCQDPQKRQDAYEMATYQMDQVRNDESKLPSAERPILKALMALWDKELNTWKQDTRVWQKMKPSNPFIFLDALRGDAKPFVDRDEELKTLKRVSKRESRQPALVYGPPRSGKQSLILRVLVDEWKETCFAPFDIAPIGKQVMSIRSILRALCEGLERRTQQKLLVDEESFTKDPMQVTKEIVRTVCNRYRVPIVIVVYNIDLLYTASSKPLINGVEFANAGIQADQIMTFWWQLFQAVSNLNFVFVSRTGNLPPNPFTPALCKIQVGNLTSKDLHKLLTMPTPDFIPLFAPESIQYIYDLTVGQPYLVQMIAHGVTDRFNRELDKDNKPEPVFTKADVDAVLAGDVFRQFGQPYVQSQRARLPLDRPIYAAVLRTIAQNEKGISPAGLDATLQGQYAWSAVEPVLAILEGQQIIKLNEAGRWQVVGELLRRVL